MEIDMKIKAALVEKDEYANGYSTLMRHLQNSKSAAAFNRFCAYISGTFGSWARDAGATASKSPIESMGNPRKDLRTDRGLGFG